MSHLFQSMASVLGDFTYVWMLFLGLMGVGALIGRLTGGFREVTLFDLATVFLVIGILASATGARFADAGNWISAMVGLLAAALMVASFFVSAVFAPRRAAREPVAVGASSLGSMPARFQTAAGYDEQGRPRG